MNIWTALAAATLCAIASPGHSGEAGPPPPQKSETLIRVLLSGGGRAASARVSSPSGFNLLGSGGSLMARGSAGAAWRIERDGRRVRAVRPDGVPTVWAEGSIRAIDPLVASQALMALQNAAFDMRKWASTMPRKQAVAFYASTLAFGLFDDAILAG